MSSHEAHEAQQLVLSIPETARLPEGASFYEGEDDGRCRLIKLDGTRCGATRMKAYGLCLAHAGQSAVVRSPQEMSTRGNEERARRATARATLGISTRRAAQPLQAARVRAQMRADAVAAALVDDVLDGDLKPEVRHRAMVETTKLLYPQVTAQLEVDVPEDEDGVRSLTWEQLQQLAAAHLGTHDVPPLPEGA